jgi:hydrophobe/amphiphile efflux-1 (HAE1) family protein
MNNISAWAIRHPITPIMLFVVLMFLGVAAFIGLPINLDPDVTFPEVQVLISQPGAAPTELENQIAQKVEGAIASVGNVRNMTTFILEGEVSIDVVFQIGTPIDRAVIDVRDAVAHVRSDLPQGILEPQVQRQSFTGPFAYYAVTTTSMSPTDLSWFVDNALTKRLLALPGVAQVSRSGGVSREIRVDLDPARMQALGITAYEVNEQLRALNLDVSGGRAQVGGGEQAIRVMGGARTPAQLADAQIIVSGTKSVRLRDIADVHDGVEEVRNIVRLNGRPATTFGVSKAIGASDVSVAKAVTAELKKITVENPGLVLTTVYSTEPNTERVYDSAISALVEGSVLAVIVVFIFLRSWRATLISALAIPLSAIPTFAFMQAAGFTLNQITLLGLSLVAGVLVDDAIVEIENIVRHMRMGKSGYQAAIDASAEIGLAVVATSFTIIAVFLPVSFMGGLSGQYFKQFGLTVGAAVFFSLMVARLITPVLAAYALRPDALLEHAVDGPIMLRYQQTLRWCVANRWKTVAGGALFFALSLYLLNNIPQAFMPPQDSSSSEVDIELPPGGTLQDTARVAAEVTALLRKTPEVTDVVEIVGGDEPRLATLYVSLVPRERRKLSQKQWQQQMSPKLQRIADGQINFSDGGDGGRDYGVYLTGDDPAAVESAARTLLRQMQAMGEFRAARIKGDLPRPEIVVRPRLDVAAELGVSVESISQTIRIATLGDLPQNGAKFSLSDRQIPIRVSLPEAARHDLATLENLPVPTAAGGTVPLKTVAELHFGQGPSAVRRYNQSRRAFVQADTAPGVELGTATKKLNEQSILKHLPPGVRSVAVGNAEFMTELQNNFAVAIGAGVLMVFAVLVLLFGRVFQPITILSALPLSLGGAVLALILANLPFSLPVIIGILMLMGIVAKNSILLVDFAIEEMRAGKDRVTAILEAGHKRARPIVMTTIAMVAGMLPVAVGVGSGSGFRQPMGVAVIGGLITSTLLTLVVVPAVFTIFDDIERWFAPRVSRILAPQPKPALQREEIDWRY